MDEDASGELVERPEARRRSCSSALYGSMHSSRNYRESAPGSTDIRSPTLMRLHGLISLTLTVAACSGAAAPAPLSVDLDSPKPPLAAAATVASPPAPLASPPPPSPPPR